MTWKPNRLNLLQLLFISGLLIFFTGYYGFMSFKNIIADGIFIASHINMTKEDKYRNEMGIVYDLTKLVDTVTETDAEILIPPQISLYSQTGNANYLRYFVYPRLLMNGSVENPTLNGINYVLVVRGEGTKFDSKLTIWPDWSIKADKVYYVNLDGSFGEYDGYYSPENFPGVNGIIKLNNK